MIGDSDEVKQFAPGYVLPCNNYHVFDITLFWANVRADVLRRLATFEGKPSPVPPPAAPVTAVAPTTPASDVAPPKSCDRTCEERRDAAISSHQPCASLPAGDCLASFAMRSEVHRVGEE